MMRRLGPWVLVAMLALGGCNTEDEAGAGRTTTAVPDAEVSPPPGAGEELHELVVLLRDELAKKEARIAKLEGAVAACEGELEASRAVVSAGGTGAPLLELPQDLSLRSLQIVAEDGGAVLTFEARSGKAFVSVREAGRTVGPLALEPILSLLQPIAEMGAQGLTPESILAGLAPEASARGTVPEAYSSWVRKIAQYEYLLLRSGLDAQLADLDALARQARIVPNFRDGVYQGFKLVGIRPGSLYRALGIRSGDVIMTVNGAAISSPNEALTLFETLREAQRIEFGVERRGREITVVYQIVEAFPGTPTAEQPAGAHSEAPADAAEAPTAAPGEAAPAGPETAPSLPPAEDVEAPIEKTHEVPKIFS